MSNPAHANYSLAQVAAALNSCGWELDLTDAADEAFAERIQEAASKGDREAIARTIIGGGTLGEALESADEILETLDAE
jgi:hypothetical protein